MATDKSSACAFCSKNHANHTCPDFVNKPLGERRTLVRNNGLCYNCMQPHFLSACSSKSTCRVCRQRHHSSLHEYKANNAQQSQLETPSVNPFSGHVRETNLPLVLATALVRIEHAGRSIVAKALVDQGSMANLITKRICDALSLPTKGVNVPISGIGGSVTCKVKKRTKFEICPHFESGESMRVDALILPKITTLSVVPKDDAWLHVNGLQLADPNIDVSGRIDLLIGAETLAELLLEGVRKRRSNAANRSKYKTRLDFVGSGQHRS